MNLEFIGFTIEVIGKIIIAFIAISVHHTVWKEHKIDKHAFRAMEREQILGIIGIALIIIGYFLQVPGKF